MSTTVDIFYEKLNLKLAEATTPLNQRIARLEHAIREALKELDGDVDYFALMDRLESVLKD